MAKNSPDSNIQLLTDAHGLMEQLIPVHQEQRHQRPPDSAVRRTEEGMALCWPISQLVMDGCVLCRDTSKDAHSVGRPYLIIGLSGLT